MSTERSRQRADQRSIQANYSGSTRKYNFSTIYHESIQEDDWNGIVLPPLYFLVGQKNLISMGSKYNLNGLLAHLFFWDRVAIPRPGKSAKLPESFDLIEYCHNEILSMASNDKAFSFNQKKFEHQRFQNRNSVRRSEVLRPSDLEWENQVQTFFALENKTPGVWSIADPTDNHKKLVSGRSLMVRLYDAIPVPANGSSLIQVAEFKQRYYTELKCLRRHVSNLFLKIQAAEDTSLSFKTEISQLRESVADLICCMEKDRLPLSFASLDARLLWSFDTRIPLTAALAGGIIADLNTALMAGVGGLAANLVPKIEVGGALGKMRGTGNPLAYAHLISSEFGPKIPYKPLNSDHFLKTILLSEEISQYVIEFSGSGNSFLDFSGQNQTEVIEMAKKFHTHEEAVSFLKRNRKNLIRAGKKPVIKKQIVT